MEITAALTADLAILSATLEDPDADILDGLRRLAFRARSAVHSYLGLTVIAGTPTLPLTLTVMEDSAHPAVVVSSLLIPLWDETAEDAGMRPAVIVYASTSGAFVDLAADLSWLTGRRLIDFALDQHLNRHAEPDTAGGVRAASLVNQAIGVLLADGYTLEQAALEIEARAAAAGHHRSDAARLILDAIRESGEPV